MASYHCTVKVGGKGKAASHSAYISREGKYSGRDRYEDLEATAHGNMPKWAEHNPAHFWDAADEHERANGATYREVEVALPRELSPEQRRELVEDFIDRELGGKHAYQWAIHTPKAALEGNEQPHAHIMYSERTIDGIDRDPDQYFKRYNSKNPEKGGCRKDSAGTEERLQATRKLWADVQNTHLERHGHEARVDHRSLKEQGIDREPEQHLGGAGVRALAQQDIAALLERRAAEGQHERAQRAVSSLIDLSGDLSAAKADRDRKAAPPPELVKTAEQRMAEFERRFELQQKVEQGVGGMEQRFAQWEAKQRQAELAKQQAVEAAAREVARQRQEAEAKQKAELERTRPAPKKDKDIDNSPGWSR
jgi:hypothetical protein